MKTIAIILALVLVPLGASAQSMFDSFADDKDVTSVLVTKNMFKLMSEMDLDSTDPEAKEYLKMVENLNDIKIFTTENPAVAKRMNTAVQTYLSAGNGLSELMRVRDDGQNIKFYSRQGKSESIVSELFMHLDGVVDGKPMTVIMSITGNIDLKQISKLTEKLNVPGGDKLNEKNKK
jgi:hypothetical protein